MLVLAIRLYEMEHGRAPERLEQLVEASILQSVPLDPFRSGPMRWDPQRRLIWSAGSDGRDHEGEGNPWKGSGKDLVWDIPEPQRP
jgi:hypothetical protein